MRSPPRLRGSSETRPGTTLRARRRAVDRPPNAKGSKSLPVRCGRRMTTLVGVLGWPVAHSRSPAMHNAAFEALGLDWRYELLPVEPERFESFVRELPVRGFAGANVTIPHKLRALALADRPSEIATATGAANGLRSSCRIFPTAGATCGWTSWGRRKCHVPTSW